MKFRSLLVLSFMLLLNPTLWSQKVTLSVGQAQDYAVENNRSSKNASLALDEAEARHWETVATGLPQVNATADYSNFLGASANLFGQKFSFNPTSNASLQVSQLVFSGSYIVGVQLSNLAKSAAVLQKQKTEHQLRIDVANAYYLALVAQRSKELIGVNLKNIKDIHQTTVLSAQVGVIEQTDLDQLTVQVGMLENSVRAIDRQIELAYNILRLQMGLSADTELELADGLDLVMNQLAQQGAVSGYDLTNNLDFQLLESQKAMAQKQINLQRAAGLPTLSAFYSHTEKLLKPEFDMSPKDVVGLNLSVPLFSSGQRNAKVKQARIQLQSIENNRELLWDQLNIQEKQARFNLTNAWEQYQNQSENLSVAQRVFDIISLKYGQGVVSGIDLITANNNYVTAQNSYVNSVLQLLQSGLELDRLHNGNLK